MKKLKQKILLSVIAFVVSLVCMSPATAQVFETAENDGASRGLSVSPSIMEEIAVPGTDKMVTLQLNNPSHIALPIKSYIREFEASDESGGVSFNEDPDSNRLSMPNWSKVIDPDFVLQPGTSRTIKIELNAPVDLPPGGYYSTVFFEILIPQKFYESSSLEIGGRVGALLFIVAKGDTVEQGKIDEVKIFNNIFSPESASLKMVFANVGNVHLKPSGELTLTNFFSGKSFSTPIDKFTVLPGKKRVATIELDGAKWPGVYKAQGKLIFGQDQQTAQADITFVYLRPVHFWFIILLIIVLVVIGSKKFRQRISAAAKVVVRGE